MSKRKPKFARFVAKPLYKIFYLNPRVKVFKDDEGVLDKIKAPALIVGNHSHAFDAMFVSTVVKPHIRWIAGAYLFKNKFIKFCLSHITTSIAKQQGRSDLSTIRMISAALKDNSIVGLFPEGTRTWDGDSIDINHKATAKLFRIFKVPVYFISLEGAYDLHPRWADVKRKGLLVIRLKKVLTIEDLNTLSLKELTKVVNENLSFSQQEWQSKVKRPFPCKNGAHGIQRLLYICPKCNKPQTIFGKKNKVYCSNCKTEDVLTELLNFEKGSFGFKTLPQWNKFQQEYIKSHPIDFKKDHGDFFRKGVDDHFEMISKNYSCCLKDKEIIFILSDGKTIVYELEKIESMVLSVKQSIEFYYEGNLYSYRLQSELNSLKYFQKWETVNVTI